MARAPAAPAPPGRVVEECWTLVGRRRGRVWLGRRLRYRTGDLAKLDVSPCDCGRTTVRMGPVRGRLDDMLIVRGINLYPSEVERILLETGGAAPHYQLVLERPGALDELTVLCEPARDDLDLDLLCARLRSALHEQTGLSLAVQVLAPGSLPRSDGKAVRVIDKRSH